MSWTHFSHGEAMFTETPGLFQRHLPQVSHRVCAAGSRCFGPSVQLFLFCSTKDVPVQVWQLRGVPTAGVQRTFVPGGHHPQQAPPCSRNSLYLRAVARRPRSFSCRVAGSSFNWALRELLHDGAVQRAAATGAQHYCRAAPLSRVPSFGADH